jgi:iron complex outermembrane receptor protein
MLSVAFFWTPAFGAASAADSADTGGLEEIVVTAEKRTESVQSVPVAITVLPSEELTRQGVQTINDLSRLSAAVEFTAPGTSVGGGAFIRGIGTETLGGVTATPSVSVVLDGVVLGNTNVTDIFDIDRVEILKGPQGTLFGSSVSAGVISITTNAPDPSAASASVNAEYGSGDLGSQYNRRSLRATANLPITADSAVRLSFHADDNIGVYTNPYEGTDSDQPSIGGRIRYLWKPNDNFTLNLIGDYNSTNETNTPVLTYRSIPTTGFTAPLPVADALAACGVTPSTDNFATCSQFNNIYKTADRGLALQLEWDFGAVSLTSITSYRLGSVGSRGDIEAIPLVYTNEFYGGCHFFNCVPIEAILPGGTNGLQTQDRKQYSEELRLASVQTQQLNWVAGVYFQHYHLVDDQPGEIIASFAGPPPGDSSPTTLDEVATTQDYAAFGNLTYNVLSELRLIAGARWTHSTVKESQYYPGDTDNNNTYDISGSASKLSWRFGAQADLAKHTMLYATISTGYKAPEIADTPSNPTLPCAIPGALQANACMYVVAPELPTSYEFGIKQSVLDNRLAIDADVFYEHVKDYQGQNCLPNNQGTVTCDPGNVPHVDTKGLELEIFGRPLEGLTLNMSAIYNPATYPPGFLAADGSSLAGHQLNYASKVKATLSAEETIPVSADYSVVFGTDYTYRSDQSVYSSGLPQFVAPHTSIWNARVGIASAKNWSVYVFGRNLGSEAFPRQIYPTPFASGGLWQFLDASSKRLVGLQLQAKF